MSEKGQSPQPIELPTMSLLTSVLQIHPAWLRWVVEVQGGKKAVTVSPVSSPWFGSFVSSSREEGYRREVFWACGQQGHGYLLVRKRHLFQYPACLGQRWGSNAALTVAKRSNGPSVSLCVFLSHSMSCN